MPFFNPDSKPNSDSFVASSFSSSTNSPFQFSYNLASMNNGSTDLKSRISFDSCKILVADPTFFKVKYNQKMSFPISNKIDKSMLRSPYPFDTFPQNWRPIPLNLFDNVPDHWPPFDDKRAFLNEPCKDKILEIYYLCIVDYPMFLALKPEHPLWFKLLRFIAWTAWKELKVPIIYFKDNSKAREDLITTLKEFAAYFGIYVVRASADKLQIKYSKNFNQLESSKSFKLLVHIYIEYGKLLMSRGTVLPVIQENNNGNNENGIQIKKESVSTLALPLIQETRGCKSEPINTTITNVNHDHGIGKPIIPKVSMTALPSFNSSSPSSSSNFTTNVDPQPIKPVVPKPIRPLTPDNDLIDKVSKKLKILPALQKDSSSNQVHQPAAAYQSPTTKTKSKPKSKAHPLLFPPSTSKATTTTTTTNTINLSTSPLLTASPYTSLLPTLHSRISTLEQLVNSQLASLQQQVSLLNQNISLLNNKSSSIVNSANFLIDRTRHHDKLLQIIADKSASPALGNQIHHMESQSTSLPSFSSLTALIAQKDSDNRSFNISELK